jgi:hypothetical protein
MLNLHGIAYKASYPRTIFIGTREKLISSTISLRLPNKLWRDKKTPLLDRNYTALLLYYLSLVF